jgi:carboxyl-terminal processing protease
MVDVTPFYPEWNDMCSHNARTRLLAKMRTNWFQITTATAAFAALCLPSRADQTNFNEVGKRMVMILQNYHFSQPAFNKELGARFLDDYLNDLDPQHQYFTQQDVDRFNTAYRDKIHTMLLSSGFMPAALDIYHTYQERVNARIIQADTLLNDDKFDFTKDESIMLSRKEAAWPKDEAEATDLWRREIKNAVLSETLRRESFAKLAKEQGKPNSDKSEASVQKTIERRYKRFAKSIKEADEEEISNSFLKAVAGAYDPHTDYMSFREMNSFRDDMKNQLVGVGALLQPNDDGSAKIMGIILGGPADKGGELKLNDRIVAVDSLSTGKPDDMVDVMFMPLDKVVEKIRGKEGTEVALKVERASGSVNATKIVVIKRGKVEMKDKQASGELIEMKNEKNSVQRMGVITLPSFYSDFTEGNDKQRIRCSVDVERILKRMMAEKIDGLVIDLRGDGGGSLDEVVRMTGLFVDRGPVVQVKDTEGRVRVLRSDADKSKALYTGPMVVMTDKGSASASEILAGALQDDHRALIIGEASTFGKGTVQTPIDISQAMPAESDGTRAGFIKLTIQKFYRPSGSSTQLEGVKSDIILPNSLDAQKEGEEYLNHPLPHDSIRNAPGFKPLAIENLDIPQLKELSEERVSKNQDFRYISENVLKIKERIKANLYSLKKSDREKELSEEDAKVKERNAEEKKRFAQMSSADKANLTFYKITLDNVDSKEALKPFDPSAVKQDYMRMAKAEGADLDDAPKWPSSLDPAKRETLSILSDLVKQSTKAEVTKIAQ